MKRVFILLITLLITIVLVGCNITPSVPNVTPYTNGTYNYDNTPYGNRTPTYKSPANSPLVRSGVNPADKVILPGAGA